MVSTVCRNRKIVIITSNHRPQHNKYKNNHCAEKKKGRMTWIYSIYIQLF